MVKIIFSIILLIITSPAYAFLDFNISLQPTLGANEPILGAPVSNIQRSIVPEATDTYYIGTTSPSRWWIRTFTNYASTTAVSALTRFEVGRNSTTTIVGDSATSTFQGGVSANVFNASSNSATSTFSNGIELSGGCVRMPSGDCLEFAGASINSGTQNRLTYYSSATILDSANFLSVDVSNSRLGIATVTPGTIASIQGASDMGSLIVEGTLKAGDVTATSSLTSLNGLTVSVGTVSLPAGEIGNTELANSSLTVTAGGGLTGGGSISLGGSATVDVGAGTGITVNTNDVALTIPVAISSGGTNNTSAYTSGSVIFSNGTSLTQNNANLFWDNTNIRLGIATQTPGATLGVGGFGVVKGNWNVEGTTTVSSVNATSTVSIATSTAFSALQVQGQFGCLMVYVKSVSTYNLGGSECGVDVDTSASAVTIIPPSAASVHGREYYVRKATSDTNTVIIDPLGTETVNGDTTGTIQQQFTNIQLKAVNGGWITI